VDLFKSKEPQTIRTYEILLQQVAAIQPTFKFNTTYEIPIKLEEDLGGYPFARAQISVINNGDIVIKSDEYRIASPKLLNQKPKPEKKRRYEDRETENDDEYSSSDDLQAQNPLPSNMPQQVAQQTLSFAQMLVSDPIPTYSDSIPPFTYLYDQLNPYQAVQNYGPMSREEFEKYLKPYTNDSSVISLLIITILHINSDDVENAINLEALDKFVKVFKYDWPATIKLFIKLNAINCFTGLRSGSYAREKLQSKGASGLYLVRCSSSTPGALVFSVFADEKLRKIIESKGGEKDSGDDVYEYQAFPMENGNYQFCDEEIDLLDIPKKKDYVFINPLSKYKKNLKPSSQ